MEPNYQPVSTEKIPMQETNNIAVNDSNSHSEKINSLSGIFVKQRMNIMEVVTGCEMENIFDIFQKHQNAEKTTGKRLWRAMEESTFVQRNCVQTNCRSFTLKIFNLHNGSLENATECLRMERACTCTCFCLNRPTISMTYTEGGKDVSLGKISDPYDMCQTLFKIFDQNDNPLYKIETYCVQCGVICKGCPCAPCERVTFQVTDLNTNQLVPPIQKTNQVCMKDFVEDSDNYGIEFAPGTSWQNKSLLLGAILFIDFIMFEEKGGF